MPVIPTAQFVQAGDVLDRARVFLNDAGFSLDGDIFSNTAPATFECLNSAYEQLQEELAANGMEDFKKEVVLVNFPKIGVNDIGAQTFVGFEGSFDGVNNFVSPALPADLQIPLKIWVRQTGTVTPWQPISQVMDSFNGAELQTALLTKWQWRELRVNFIGATIPNDIRMEYMQYMPQLVDEASPVMIPRSKNAMAYLTAAIFAASQGDPESPMVASLEAAYDEQVRLIMMPTIRMKQRITYRRKPYSRGRWGKTNQYFF